jgi:hypothetical protein
VKSFSNHVQQSPECKVFVLDQTAINAVPLPAPSKEALANTTAPLFKKQRLWLNPSFTEQQHAINVMNTHIVKNDASMNDDDICLSDHDSAHHSELLMEDITSDASEESLILNIRMVATMFLLRTALNHRLKVITHVSPQTRNVSHH